MANAAAEEDKLIQNLLNEIKGIEAGGGEIEVPEGTIEFGEVTWNNGQAEVEILANTIGVDPQALKVLFFCNTKWGLKAVGSTKNQIGACFTHCFKAGHATL